MATLAPLPAGRLAEDDNVTPRRSIIGTIVESRWFSNDWRRRGIFLAALLVLAALSLFPRHYRAAVTLAPQDANTAGLSSILANLGANYAAILAAQTPVEIDLTLARSLDVRKDVARELDLTRRWGYDNPVRSLRRLERDVDVSVLRGGIIEIATKNTDPALARGIISATANATQARLAALSRRQTAFKRQVLGDRMNDASVKLLKAQTAFDTFRTRNRLAEPGSQLAATTGRLTGLQSAIAAKEVELSTARQFRTDRDFQVLSIQAEITSLRRQAAEVSSTDQPGNTQTLAGVVSRTTTYENLYRDLQFAKSLYEAYTRYLEGTAIEELAADYNIRILEEPYVDPDRQFNTLPVGLFVMMLCLALATEFYLARPPVGALRGRP